MNYQRKVARSGLTAIAAGLALSATPTLARTVDQVASATAASPAPGPIAVEPAPVMSDAASVATPVDVAPPVSKAEPRAKAAPKTVAKSTTRTAATRVTSAARPVPVTSTPTTTTAAVPASLAADTNATAPQPIAPITPASDVTPGQPLVAQTMQADETLPLAGAAGLGIIALAGAGLAMRRRRRRADEVIANEPSIDDGSAALPTIDPVTAATRAPATERPAFAWAPPAATTPTLLPASIAADSIGHHVRAAYEGPSPNNPSLVLKKRLKRAAFFDLRDRQAAAGEAMPTVASGLPKAVAPTSPMTDRYRVQPTSLAGPGVRFGRAFQPASARSTIRAVA